MADKLVELVKFENPFQAETVRIALVEHGIKAFVESSETTRAMHYVGTALGGVKILVPENQRELAKEVLAAISDPTEADSAPPWICGECGEEVEGSFETCWSCGALKTSESSAAVPPKVHLQLVGPFAEAKGESYAEAPAWQDRDESEDEPPAKPAVAAPTDEMIEALLNRAWRASVIGLFFCPIGLHFYSAYLFISAREALHSRTDYTIPPPLARKCTIAKFINWGAIAVGIFFLIFWRSQSFH